jgi:hypothetical protein
MLLFCVWACHGPDPRDPRPQPESTPEPVPTGDTAQPLPFEAACTQDPVNVLRVWCTATLIGPGTVRVELTPLSSPEEVLTFTSSESQVEHTVFAWGLFASESYSWRILDEATGLQVTGSLVTGELPPELVDLDVTNELDLGSQLDAVLFAPGCPGGVLVMVDRKGRIIWYHRMGDLDPALGGAINISTWTEDGTILAVIGKSALFEIDLAGNILMRADRGVQFEHYLHHELFKRDGHVYVLRSTTEVVDDVEIVADGVYVFDSSGNVVDELSVAGLWPIVVQPLMLGGYWSGLFLEAVDFSHVNSVWVEESGDIWLSFRHLHAFGKFRGGPGSTGFGELLWMVVGQEDSPIAGMGDFELSGDDPYFEGQHDVHPAEDGTVLMLDNGLTPGDFARGVRYLIDETEGKVSEIESWNLGLWCPIQGSVRELPGGNVLITCASLGRMREYDAERNIVWETSALCRDALPSVFSRGMPVYR